MRVRKTPPRLVAPAACPRQFAQKSRPGCRGGFFGLNYFRFLSPPAAPSRGRCGWRGRARSRRSGFCRFEYKAPCRCRRGISLTPSGGADEPSEIPRPARNDVFSCPATCARLLNARYIVNKKTPAVSARVFLAPHESAQFVKSAVKLSSSPAPRQSGRTPWPHRRASSSRGPSCRGFPGRFCRCAAPECHTAPSSV